MQTILQKMNNFQQKIQFVADSLMLTANSVDDKNVYTETEQYSIVEPFIEALIEASKMKVEEVEEEPVNDMKRIADELIKGNKIASIKQFRTIFGTGIKDSKEEVERVYNGTMFTVDRWEYDGKLIWKR